jgi:hyaluronan synthase
MIAFAYQLMDWIRYAQPHFFVAFFVYVWLVWTTKMLGSRRYAPAENDFTATTSVIMPVFEEDPAVLRAALGSIAANQPDEILVVIDGGDDRMAAIAREFTDRVWQIPKAGKRTALQTAIPETAGEVVIIVDSDTIFSEGVVRNLVKPFADPAVGGATTNQRIFDPDRTFCRHCSDWMEYLRFTISTPAQSSFGTVGCLPGRAIALRREILLDSVDDLLDDRFLGIRCEIGDDRTLTNFTLKRGYRTVFQSTALVYTDAPDHWGRFIRQQLRWARSSQRETLKSLRWLVRKPFLAFCFISDILTPFLLLALVLMLAYHWLTGQTDTAIIAGTPLDVPLVAAAAAYVGAILSIGIRQLPRFRRYPGDILLLPVFVLALTFILIPVRIAGFMTMGEQNWITRRSAAPGRRAARPSGRWAPKASDLFLLPAVALGRVGRYLAVGIWRAIRGGSRPRSSEGVPPAMEAAGEAAYLRQPVVAGQAVTPRVWAVRGLTLMAGLTLLASLFWFGVNFEQREDPYANYREQIEEITGR